MQSPLIKSDRILPITRWVAAFVVPFLLAAFIILYLIPSQSGRWFAWDVNPNMTDMFMGAGYLGGAYLFLNVIFGRRWHRVSPGFLPVTAFTVWMLLATIIHRDRFDILHLPFLIWLILYITTPIIVPLVWFLNRRADPAELDQADKIVPSPVRWILRIQGVLLLVSAVTGFISPASLMAIWPWTLSALTARVMAGWFALLGVGGIRISLDARWSAWQVGLVSIALWHALVLLAALLNREEFSSAGVINWYTASVALVLLGMIGLTLWMKNR